MGVNRTPDKTLMQAGAVFISRIVAALRPVQVELKLRNVCPAGQADGGSCARTSGAERDRENTRKRQPPRTTKVA